MDENLIKLYLYGTDRKPETLGDAVLATVDTISMTDAGVGLKVSASENFMNTRIREFIADILQDEAFSKDLDREPAMLAHYELTAVRRDNQLALAELEFGKLGEDSGSLQLMLSAKLSCILNEGATSAIGLALRAIAGVGGEHLEEGDES